jgi:hypothetical protein
VDWLKVSIERFFAFLATLIPGSAVLLLFVLHRQQTLENFWKTEALSYETKIAIVILCTFAAGFAVQDALSRLGGAIGGAIGGFLGTSKHETEEEDEVQPWRNRVWRALLKGYLGPSAPEDIQYIYKKVLDQKS